MTHPPLCIVKLTFLFIDYIPGTVISEDVTAKEKTYIGEVQHYIFRIVFRIDSILPNSN